MALVKLLKVSGAESCGWWRCGWWVVAAGLGSETNRKKKKLFQELEQFLTDQSTYKLLYIIT